MGRLGQLVVRRRTWVIAAWIVATAALALPASRLGRELEVSATIRGSEAGMVDSVLLHDFRSPFARYAVLVASGVPSPDTPAGTAALARIIGSIDTVSGVTATLSWRDANDSLFRPAGGGTFILVGLNPAHATLDALVPRIRASTVPLARELAATYPGATLRWTGSAPVNFDIRSASALQGRRAESRALPLTLVLLMLAFGTLAAAVLPLVSASVAIVSALGLAALVNRAWPLSIVLENIATMVGLGVGVDYALLTVARFRESLASGANSTEAAIDAADHAGATIAMSGLAVCIGFVALLVVPLNELQSVGVAGMLVVGCSVLMAATLLPALLAILGARVDAGRIRLLTRQRDRQYRFWRGWGQRIVAHPVLVLSCSAIPLLALAWPARRLNPDLPRGNWLPRGIESGLAIGDLIRMQRGGVVNAVRVLVQLPSTASLADSAGWSAVRRLSDTIAADARVRRVASVSTAFRVPQPPPALFQLSPGAQRTLMSRDWRATVIEASPRDSLELNDITTLVRDLRRLDVERVTGVRGARILVGGIPALNADYLDATTSRFTLIVALVIGGTLVALMAGFRSILVPIKAVALNLLSVAAAYGAVVLVFQDGHAASLVGLDAPMHGVFPTVPILAFCVVFGLSMDYEVFLVSRIAEARRTLGEHDAVTEGLARTGGIITSAAAIMIAVFGAFTLGQFLFIKVLGFALAVAVLLDATIVRMALGPALFVLAGRWNWWPGGNRR